MSITLPYESVEHVHQILDMDKYNGRVNLVEPADKHARFRMQEKVHIRNTASNYYEALNGQLELNILSKVFFFRREYPNHTKRAACGGAFHVRRPVYCAEPKPRHAQNHHAQHLFAICAKHCRPNHRRSRTAKYYGVGLFRAECV